MSLTFGRLTATLSSPYTGRCTVFRTLSREMVVSGHFFTLLHVHARMP